MTRCRLVLPALLSLLIIAAAAACASDGESSDAPAPGPATAPASPPATAAPAQSAPAAAPITDRYGGVLRVAQARDPASCDLAMSGGISYQAVHPCNPMLSQIVRIDPADHGNILPDLSERWELSSDGTAWTFDVRADAQWHDGSPVTAADLKFSLDRVIDPPTGLAVGRAGPIAGYISTPGQVTAPDAATLRVTTDFPAASFLYNLASVYVSVYPKTRTAALDPPTMAAFSNVIGSGPFKARSAVRGSVYEMERNDHYYEPGLPYLDGISYFIMPEPAVRLAALKAHQIDLIMIVTEDEAV
ncbi:MAG: ABC transporter substrate-binding protein, partial [Dehalococcoidia bacterium]